MKIAVVDKCQTNQTYKDIFDFDFDLYHLCSVNQKKVLKKDIDLDIDLDLYNFVITVGSEPTKFLAKKTSVINFQGSLVDNKYLPLTNPNMFTFRPDGIEAFKHALENIHKIIAGELKVKQLNLIPGKDKNIINTWLDNLINSNVNIIAVDTETSAFYPRQGHVLGISLAYTENEGIYIDSDAIDEEIYNKLYTIFNTKTCVFHNAKFDIHMLKYHFVFNFPSWEDTALIHYCLDENPGTHGLKELVIKYTNIGDYEKELDTWKKTYCRQNKIKISDFTYDLIPFDIIYKYAATDAVSTLTLYNMFIKVLEEDSKLVRVYNKLLKAGTDALLQIEDNGVPFDAPTLLNASNEMEKELMELETKLYEYSECQEFERITGKKINPGSPLQLRQLLYQILNLSTNKLTETGELSTDAEVLEELAELHEIPRLLLSIRKLKKIKSTYIDKIIEGIDPDSRLRTNFNQIFTSSGRLSSSGKLNMQQLPRDNKIVKKCIKARAGYKIVSQDLKTAEMWVAAALSGDEALAEFFKTGGDYHGFMAVQKFSLPCEPNDVAKLYPKERQAAKTVSFEILYKLNLNEPILSKFNKLKKWLEDRKKEIETNGEIYQIFGRKRRLPNVFSKNRAVANHEVRSGVNALVQGPSSDINLFAAIDMVKWINENKYTKDMLIFALVHDSIVAEVKEDLVEIYCKQLKEFTQKNRGLYIENCPIGVDIEIGNDYSFQT